MKLWLLRPVGYGTDDIDPLWVPWYDKTFGFVVRAETEAEARTFAQANAGDEKEIWEPTEPWTSAEHSTCVESVALGPAGVVIEDKHREPAA
jgi:hypothetical protein